MERRRDTILIDFQQHSLVLLIDWCVFVGLLLGILMCRRVGTICCFFGGTGSCLISKGSLPEVPEGHEHACPSRVCVPEPENAKKTAKFVAEMNQRNNYQ